MAARLIVPVRLEWLGQEDDGEAPPPITAPAKEALDTKWSPGEKIMLAMLAINAAWFAWSVWTHSTSNPGSVVS
jgi:hypothetical protein